eukprot:Blabericola_migrator_1__174@NODE_1047_length_5611_cov_30_101912_g721_i0_p1_GENE_NODE_1047_length_5611_cov_30_101912_g721_i0NODE_1047_length_5611_cov_30_101912_g721_i0_p1_ORF_typecomplete_len1247_score182_23_NODE_1047_length_5611_cov_30_101912_g721_i01613901
MPGTRQCILSKYRTSRTDISTIKTLSFGICCAVGGREGVDFACDNASSNSAQGVATRHRPPHLSSLQPGDVISTFCKEFLGCKVPRDPPDWFLLIQDAFSSLHFVTSSLPTHIEELLNCVTKVQVLLLEKDSKALPFNTPTEVEALNSIHCLFDHLNKAVTASGASCGLSGVLQSKFAAVQEYCRTTLPYLRSGLHKLWHERLQDLLIDLQLFRHPRLRYVMVKLLKEAEQALQYRCFTDAELATLTHVRNTAYDYAALRPHVAQISELQAKHETIVGNSGAMQFQQTETEQTETEQPFSLAPQQSGHFQAATHDVRATTNVEWPALDTTPQEWPNVEQQGSFPTWAENEVVRQLKEFEGNVRGDPGQSASQSTTGGPIKPMTESVKSEDGMPGLHPCGDALHQACSAPAPVHEPREHFLDFENVLEEEIEQAARQNTQRDPKHLKITETLNALSDASLKLAQTSPQYSASFVAALNDLRSSLLRVKRKIECTPYVRATVWQRRTLDQVIWNISRTWHRLRLIDLNLTSSLLPGQPPLQPSEIQVLTDFERPVPSFVASHIYGALLEDNGDEGGVDDFFEYLISTSNPIDLSTAKLCLLILLFLKHDYVNLIPQGGEELMDKLTARLRHELFTAKVTEVSLFNLPEFIEFSSQCYGADKIPKRGWQASLQEKGFWPRTELNALVWNLNRLGKAFRLGLEELPALPTESFYADQINLLKKLYVCLQSSAAPDVSEFEAFFEQTSNFAEACIAECNKGHPASQHHMKVLEVTRDSLHWCRLLSAYLRVTPPNALKNIYTKISTAWIFKSLWSREQTLFLTNSDRAYITKKILSLLEDDQLHYELSARLKAFLDQNIPHRFVELTPINFKQDQTKTLSDDDKIIDLLTHECRLKSVDSTSRTSRAMRRAFETALIQARMIAMKYPRLSVPDSPLNANLERRFVSQYASDSAAQLLSLDAVLKDALEGLPDELSVDEVARHIATCLLRDTRDDPWLDYIVQDVKWCSYTAQQLMNPELGGELLTLTENLDVSCRSMFQFGREDLTQEATPYLIRHFVNLAILKWISDSTVACDSSAKPARHTLRLMLGKHAAVWVSKWLVLMHDRQALFPSDITVHPEFFETLYEDVRRRSFKIARPTEASTAALTPDQLYGHLRYMLKGLSAGTLTRQDIAILARKAHEGSLVSKASSNVFLAFLLYAWHHRCLHAAESNPLERCVKTVMNEISNHEEGGMPITTMQRCLEELLSIWNA